VPVVDVHPRPGLGSEKLERACELLGRMVDEERDAECPAGNGTVAAVPDPHTGNPVSSL
jgi:hypothetical protein